MPDIASPRPRPTLLVAAALASAAAVSLGLSRFSYALLLPPMRTDLGWSYLTAGAMNTVNAVGYLIGAMLLPAWIARFPVRRVLLSGSAASAALLAAHGLVLGNEALYALRLLTGVASAATFVSGSLLAARLTGAPAGLVLGIYYGGAGVGIVMSSVLVPPLAALNIAHAWQSAWFGLGALALLATWVLARVTRDLAAAGAPSRGENQRFDRAQFVCGLVSYFLFGLGYIGYMTFVVTLLREQQIGSATITVFYGLLGVCGAASSWLWAGVLQRYRGGQPMAVLNGLLAVATVLPVLSAHPVAVFASGAIFGSVFLSVVASTTALVRHNLPAAQWSSGIAAFTIVFAAGQIVGPTLVGWLSDGAGGLRTGLAVSAAVLALGAAFASRQKALPLPQGHVA